MRKIRDVLRYRHSTGLSLEAIARALRHHMLRPAEYCPPDQIAIGGNTAQRCCVQLVLPLSQTISNSGLGVI